MAPAPSAKTERLMNLVMTLLRTRRPLTRHEIRRTVEQYQLAASDEAFERMFERDKDELRELGVPLDTVEADAYFDDELGYRIRPDEYVVPEISFEPDELVVLGLAARTWSHGTLGGAAAQALRKLEATAPDSVDAAPGLVEPVLGASEPTFPEILRAVQELREIRFDYRGPRASDPMPRRLQPWRLSQLRGHWYVTGFDLDRQQERVFRLSRIVGEVRRHGRAGAYVVPADVGSVDVAAAVVAADGEPVTAEVEVRSGSGIRLRRTAQVVAEFPDGTDTWTRLRLEDQPAEWVVSSIAALLGHARAVEPESLRAEVVARLDALIAAHGEDEIARLAPAAEAALGAGRATGRRGHGSAEPATERLSRLLSMVPWLVHRQGIDLGEAAERLGVGEEQLRADLDLLFMCGYGSMPDELI
ncbi:MAG TPA: WYL domain-containing protein, partial [Intrasporangiaceae bacterium]|nr:WYL domain-containing protein [Intrasporangiaceae bacterium]